MAAYAHLHAASYTGFARSFVEFCNREGKEYIIKN